MDHGTPELQLYRQALVKNGDPTLSENPISVLLARGIIGPAQHQAGEQLEKLRSQRFGVSPHARAASMDEVRGGHEKPDGAHKAIRDRWEAAERVLRDCGTLAWHEVQNTTVYRRWPGWWSRYLRGIYRKADARRQEALKAGLKALADHWGIQDRADEAA